MFRIDRAKAPPPPHKPPDPPEAKKVPLLKHPKKEDNPVKKRRQPQKKTNVQSNKITSMFVPVSKNQDNNLSQVVRCNPSARAVKDQQKPVQRCESESDGQTQDSLEPGKVNNIFLSNQALPGKPDLAVKPSKQKLSLSELNTGIPANLVSNLDQINAS